MGDGLFDTPRFIAIVDQLAAIIRDALWRQVFARDIARRELQARQKAEWRARQAA